MSNKNLRAVSLAVLLSLTLSLVFPVGVLADDAQPPAPEATEVAAPPEEAPTEEGVAVDEVVSESPDTEEPALTEDATVPEAEAQEDTALDANVAPLLDQLPEGTDVVVLDAQGEVVPLVSQEATAVIASSDPMWCPDGVAPIANTGGCTGSYSSMTALLTAISGANQKTQNGTIWIEKTYNSSTAEPLATDRIWINGDANTTWRDYSLTIMGGWDGDAAGTISGTSLFSGDRLWIENWRDNITVKNILITNAAGDRGLYLDSDNNTPTSGATDVFNVTVENVTVTGTTTGNGYGLYIDTNEHVGVVTVNNSTFTNNGNDGIYIEARGNVTLRDITSTGNADEGAEIINTDSVSTTRAFVTVNGTNVFSGNTGNGLLISSDGAITLNNVTADNSINESGAVLNNNQGDADSSSSVTITGINSFSGNDEFGLQVDSKGAVTLENITADNNERQYGAKINNDVGGATAAVSSITITGDNSFNGNDDYGLQVDSRGAVSFENITAESNKTQYGVDVDNESSADGNLSSVTVSGTNSFSSNDDYGLRIISMGTVSLENVTANGNKTEDGVSIDNDAGTGNVTLTGTQTFTNNGNDNNDDGLNILSKGNVTLASVIATGNKDEGVDIDNTPSSNRTFVTIGGTNLFSGNTGNGLVISSDGAINLNNVTSSNSVNDSGAVLNNDQSGANSSSSITITGTNIFSGNDEYGLQIDSRGAVNLENITADSNKNQYGVDIDNESSADGNLSSVTVSGTNSFSSNDDYGLRIVSMGTVSLENVTANGNKTQYGVSIDNDAGTGNVTLTGTQTFTNNGNDNNDDGLNILSKGNVTLANVIATGNKDEGVEINNTPNTSLTPTFVTIGGTNLFSGNTGNGLVISSDGAINLNNVTSSNSVNDSGAWLNNNQSQANSSSNVTLTGTNIFSGNYDFGLQITSKAVVNVDNVTANDNKFDDGVNIDNSVGTGSVTLTGTNTFTNNGNDGNDDGLYVRSKGEITLVGVTATLNKDDGAELDNLETGSTSNIFVIASSFNNNADDGLYADSNGNITLINVAAKNNLHDGVELNFPSSATPTITICGGEYSGQFGTGAGDYDVQVNNGDTRNTNLPFSNWSPNTWGAAICSTYTDADGDQVPDQWDTDDDNDLILDGADNCSLVSNADQANADGDSQGNACDADDDNDTLPDGIDTCPIGAAAGTDTDGDGCKDDVEDLDDDNDGVADASDSCPVGASTGTDTDGDGCKNTEDLDDDGDGVLDVSDAFPLEPGESADVDGDGVGNNADLDDDNDGVEDTKDAFPLDSSEWVDTDGDGTGNNDDLDDDNDGHLDIKDAFPLDPSEWWTPRTLQIYPNALFIPITGQMLELSCALPSTLLDAEGFKVEFTSLCGYSAVSTEVLEDNLPGALPDGSKFVGGIEIVLLQDGSPVATLPADTSIKLSADVPSGMKDESMAILHWDSAAGDWVELNATVRDGKVSLGVDVTGIFVLVGK